jgi:D-serine deaminase-like pyridoxal phosphate-dependent protein
MMRTYDEYKSIFANIPRPFAFVDLDLLDANIEAIAQRARTKHVRVASKSLRCPALMQRILQAYSVFQGVMAFTAREAVFLSDHGFDDILLGYPVWDAAAIGAVIDRISNGKQITFIVDSIDHVQRIETIAVERNVRVPLCLDIDMSSTYFHLLRFGVWRSPLDSWAKAQPTVQYIAASASVWLDGVMGYEAQIAGLGDNMPGQNLQNRIVRALKRSSIREVAQRRAEVVARIREAGIPLRFVNAGGTGSFDSSREENVVTEITAGSGFYAPGLFDNYTQFQYLPAVAYAVEVVRHPAPGIVTCAGGGYVASGPAGVDKLPKPYLPEGMQLFPREAAGEVQTPLRCDPQTPLSLGDPVFFRHAKAGEVCERFPSLYAISNGAIVDEIQTYRGMGACFL